MTLRAQALTQQLITFSAGGTPVKKSGSICTLIREATRFALSDANVTTQFMLAKDLWTVEYDEGQLRHVINNIVTNALEAMPEGGTLRMAAQNQEIRPETDPHQAGLAPGRYVCIAIEDTGRGIPRKHRPMIFDPYFSTKEKGVQKGMGLGLATVYSIVHKHGGHIFVESVEASGTTLRIYLPVGTGERDEKPAAGVTTSAAETAEVRRVLLMDDEKMVRTIAGKMLVRLGCDVAMANDGRQAIDLYRQALEEKKPFDAVILDLTVKRGMGGKETLKRLQELDPAVRAFVSSGYSTDPVITGFQHYGFMGALPKPYALKDLRLALGFPDPTSNPNPGR